MEFFPLAVAILFFLVGLAGTVLPVLPGTPVVFLGMVVYGLLTGFENLDVFFFLIQGLAVVIASVLDHVATAIGTKQFGGSRSASWGAIIGIPLGAILLGPLGLLIGAFAGAFLGEFITSRRSDQALKTGLGALMGFLGSSIMKLTIALVMITWFFIRIL